MNPNHQQCRMHSQTRRLSFGIPLAGFGRQRCTKDQTYQLLLLIVIAFNILYFIFVWPSSLPCSEHYHRIACHQCEFNFTYFFISRNHALTNYYFFLWEFNELVYLWAECSHSHELGIREHRQTYECDGTLLLRRFLFIYTKFIVSPDQVTSTSKWNPTVASCCTWNSEAYVNINSNVWTCLFLRSARIFRTNTLNDRPHSNSTDWTH